ncbi:MULTISPECIES: hypothetical protein [unclassified Moorena]|uniref:hypothetical protein n=1 Tax=unclassified Moorena TaxID=2683338 RepID=UPI0013C198AD|nr:MULTISPECIES: hypothetical protein [unclassified Moorena]NEO08537.1 hypothetical protein [Moorena sp. SIO3I8]NEO21755.1 hypothetical protein [Moorena sp. SIO4A5]NEQ60761.1 hypothetical protein [Moorena sp. SIO4A1]
MPLVYLIAVVSKTDCPSAAITGIICRLGRGFLNHRQEKTPGTVKDFHRDAQVKYD